MSPMSANLCRRTGYAGVLAAVRMAAVRLAEIVGYRS